MTVLKMVPAVTDISYRHLPWVHITLSNLKRFLLGTHHKVEPQHLQRYVAEFNNRLNRRTMETNFFRRCAGI